MSTVANGSGGHKPPVAQVPDGPDALTPDEVAAAAKVPDAAATTTTSKAAVANLIAEDESKGSSVHAFDPDAPPEAKAAAAGSSRSQIAPLPKQEDTGRAVAIDTSRKTKPTITLADVDLASRAEGQGDTPDVPGTVPTGAAPAVPTFLQIGWKQSESRQLGILADYLSEQMYGSWYHNAGIIFFAVLTTRFITVLHLGWGWILIILISCASYYSLSIARTRHRARDDIQRELVKTRLVTETESADWLNGFMDRFWLIYEPVLSQTIVASVDAVLVDNCPSFLESIRLTTFTLGTKAPRIDYVRTFPKTPDDVVIMDWAISFTPTDLQDITPRQAKDKVNPKIVLAIRVGKGAVSKALPILLEDMSFTGRMRIKLKLMTNFPHVQAIDMSFIEKPTFDYVLKPLGGETFGFDINNIPGLAPFIREQVHANLGPMMYDPNVFTIDLAALLSGTPLDAAIGVLKITVNDARGLKAVKLGGGAPDPYVAIALGAKPPVAQTQTVPSTSNPSFQSTHFLLINTLGDMLNLSLYDYNEHRPDNLLGAVTQELGTLAEDAEQQHVGKIIGGGKDRGELRYDLSYFPVMTPTKNPDGTFEPLPDVQTGIVRLTIHQAKDFDRRELNPFARVLLGKQTVHKTPVLKHTSQPIWESHVEFLVPEKHNSVVTVQVYNSKDYDPHLGSLSVRLTDLLEARARSQDWFPLAPKGKVRLTAEWKPVAMTGSLSGAAVYTPPIGILRIWLKSASDVKNVEAALGGKSDPYVRVMGANKILARTEVVNNNLNPQWDQIVYVPVHSGRENLMLELMDYQNIGKDRSLGYVELKVGDCVEPQDDVKYPYASRGHQVRNERIKLSNGYKGSLSFEVDFKPAVALRDVSFEAEKNELELAAEATAAENGEPLANGAPSPAPEKPGVSMDTDSLLRTQSGILAFQVVSGSLARRGSLEVMLDDGYWPSFVSSRARSNTQKWDQIGEGFVRELDFSRIWFRLNAADDSAKEDIVAEFRCDTKEFLELCLGSPQEFLLSQADGSNRSVVKISARYVPVDIVLEPRESINNMGVLRVDVLDAKNLLAGDRSGKSDPNVTFFLNGAKVFKSETKKKTLNPEWNEKFEVMVPSRVAANFLFEVADWNQVGTSTSLGKNVIDLASLEPFESAELNVPVIHEKGAKGNLHLRLLFQPEIIARSRQKTSTFSAAGRAITQIGGLPMGVGKGVMAGGGTVAKGVIAGGGAVAGGVIAGGGAVAGGVASGIGTVGGGVASGIGTVGGGVAHGIGSVGGFAGRRMGLVKKEGNDDESAPVPSGAANIAADGVSQPSPNATPPEVAGTLTVTVLSAKDLKSTHKDALPKPYVSIRCGGKTHKTEHLKGPEVEWNETLSFHVAPSTTTFKATVYDHHTLGKDPELGEAEVEIWRHLAPPADQTAEVATELTNGNGLLRLRLDWTPGAPAKGLTRSASRPSIGSKDSPGKFSLRMSKKAEEST